MLKYVFILLVTVLFSSSAYAAINIKEKEYPAINGVQVFVMDARYKNDVGAFFREVKTKGVDTVFFRVFHNLNDRPHFGINLACPSGVYFKTRELCTVNDLLGAVAKAARQNDIRLYAWMATRSLTDLKSGDKISLAFSPDGGVTAGYGANIFKPVVRASLIRLFKDLASYDIDGILFQDDFIIKYTEGADAESVRRFKAETGLKADPDTFFTGIKEYNGKKVFTGFTDEFYVWAEWKAGHIGKLFAQLKNAAVSVNPDIRFAANIYYETPIKPRQGLEWYSQKIPLLLAAGADYLAVMGYHEQIGAELKQTDAESALFIGEIAAAAVKNVSGNHERVIMKLQGASFLAGGKGIRPSLFREVCRSVRKTDNLSVAVVPVFSGENILNSCFSKNFKK